jgi:hypothetical protein
VNLLKTPLRRATAVVAGTFIGLGGAVALAAPASAHAPTLSHSAPCVSKDGWTIDWSIGNDFGLDANVVKAEVTDKAGKKLDISDVTTGTLVPKNSDVDASKQIHGLTKVTDESTTEVTLTVILKWTDGYTNDGQKIGGDNNGGYGRDKGHRNGPPLTEKAYKPTTPCETTPPVETPPVETPPVETPPVETPPVTTAPPVETTAPPSSPTPTPTETGPVLPVPTPSTSDEPAEFTPIVEMDCTTITIGMDNPAKGIAWGMHFKTTKGEERDITVNPGEKKTEKFSATAGFKVTVTLTVTVEGKTYSDFTTIAWEKPDNCDNGSGGGLPVTGAAAGGIAGGAALLLAAGGFLFFMARRRKVKFTA